MSGSNITFKLRDTKWRTFLRPAQLLSENVWTCVLVDIGKSRLMTETIERRRVADTKRDALNGD